MLRQSPAALRAIGPVAAVLVASLGVIGADALWLVAAGRNVGSSTLSFAGAPTANWHNAPVLGELVFRGLFAMLHERGLVVANALAAAIALGALALGLRREGATAGSSALVSLLVVAGALPTFVVVRNGLFTLAFFPLLLLLLEDDALRRSRRIWLAVPLVALWGNCHGGVLIGFALLAVYVLVARRDATALAALAVSALALLLATPQLWHTPQYYVGVMQNEAARTGVGQWAPLFRSWWDVPLIVAAAVLVAAGARSFRGWEAVAAIGLAAASIHTARIGTWLLFVAAYPAGRALRLRRPASLPVVVPLFLAVLAIVTLARAPADLGSRALAARAARSGGVVLADAILAEQVEAAGGRVWVANPLDAFRRSDQRLYLDWLEGNHDGQVAVTHAQLVLVGRDSAAGRVAARDRRLAPVARDGNATLYRVHP